MKLLTAAQRARLLKNGADPDGDPVPVVKLFTPDAQATWLLTSIEPVGPAEDGHYMAFGLCDLGMGYPELGYVDLRELAELRGPMGLPVERDMYCKLQHPISVYAAAARKAGRITLQVAA